MWVEIRLCDDCVAQVGEDGAWRRHCQSMTGTRPLEAGGGTVHVCELHWLERTGEGRNYFAEAAEDIGRRIAERMVEYERAILEGVLG